MGMYDSIECKCWLPMPDEPKGYTGSHGFQTKDFDCALDIYIIDENGKMHVVSFHSEGGLREFASYLDRNREGF